MNTGEYKQEENELYKSAHLMILLSYTMFSVILCGESLLMGWEKWALVLIVFGLALAWVTHIRHWMTEYVRLWMYSLLMMATFFFYGIHVTSTFDIAVVMLVVVMIYTMTGYASLLNLCMITYFVTFAYGLASMYLQGETFDPLVVSRSMLHVGMIIMAGWVGRTIIDKWNSVIGNSAKEIRILKEQTDRLNHFLANVSHEIRTPINAVMGLSSVLEKENLPPQISENVYAISQAGHRVAEQMGDILDYTEIDMDKLSVSREVYMISSLINDVLTQLSLTEEYGLGLIVDMESRIPAELIGDAEKIKKILWHLITNGYKFTREGGVFVHIYPIKREYGINLILEVKDTGVGIAEDEMDHIYEGFYQSDSGHTRTAGGLGLGLSIVNGFVKAMSGVMTVESKPGEGTCVRVSIPQEVEDPGPCLSVRDKENCSVAGFLGFMTTGHASVREYYMEMITHLVIGLAVPFQRVQSIAELDKLISSTHISHLFVGTGEYLENRAYIDALKDSMNVAIVMDRDFRGEISPGLTPLPKPFYGGQVANFLNHAFDAGVFHSAERMVCPGLKVLVVDDEPMNLLVARGIFEAYEMEVSTASGGEESIRMCEDNDYDVVFMDHMMPGMDGVEAMKRIKSYAARTDKDITVIALTANAISSAKEMFLSEGFDGFVPKPIELSELERVLKRELPKDAIEYRKIEDSSYLARSGVRIQNPAEPAEPDSADLSSWMSSLNSGGIDTARAIKYCAGDQEFYKQLLTEYASDKDEKISNLHRMYASADWENYKIRVHAVKSTSRMIGAEDLSEMAYKLEQAAGDKDTSVIDSVHPGFMDKYAYILGIITDAMKRSDPASDSASDNGEDAFEAEEDQDGVFEFDPGDEDDDPDTQDGSEVNGHEE